MGVSIPVNTTASPSAPGQKRGFSETFRAADGSSYVVPFVLVCTLFFLWGFTNGMLDVLNKQFQNSLGLSKS